MKKSVLITDGAGFIGSFLTDKLIESGHDVTIFDNLEPQVHNGKVPKYINEKAAFLHEDIREYDAVKKSIQGQDIVVNFAARVGVGQSMYQIKDYVSSNSLGTANLLHALANEKHDVRKMIVASSMSIYGEGSYNCEKCRKAFHDVERSQEQLLKNEWDVKCPTCGTKLQPVPTSETKPLSNSSIYAITKKNQEEMSLNIGRAYGIPTVALRFFNVYGPRQSLNNPYTGVAAIFISRIKNNKSPLIFEDGKQSRDFVSVHDIVQGCILSMEKAADYETFNIGTGKQTSINEIANTLLDLLNPDLDIELANKYRKGDIRNCFADISKIRSKLGYEPKISLKKGMQELLEWSSSQDASDKLDKAFDELKEKKLI